LKKYRHADFFKPCLLRKVLLQRNKLRRISSKMLPFALLRLSLRRVEMLDKRFPPLDRGGIAFAIFYFYFFYHLTFLEKLL
jgi:hypothetical protein